MAIIGAILGDICGSAWEFNRDKSIDFENIELFTDANRFTDDTVLTVATKYAIENSIEYSMAYHIFGNAYPKSGYGSSFRQWLKENSLSPYYSYGNGSAMRVSPVIDLSESWAQVVTKANFSAICTHNHPEGLKGAIVTAVCGWMAKEGASKREIEEYAIKQYPKDSYAFSVELPLDVIKENYYWNDICQGTVPVAIRCFIESENYESFLRNAISLCGDSDTIACIGGCIAEEYYGSTGFDNKQLLKRYLDDRLYSEIEALIK